MQKAYERINWENYPSDKTPLNEANLNKLDVATDEIDNRVITLDSTKFDKTEASKLIKNFELDKATGIITITYLSGATVIIDTLLEKLAVNFDFDEATQKIIITLDDGTVKEVDLSSFITEYEFLDSDTVAFTVDANGKVVAIVKEGSIEEKHLRPNYLADIKVEVAKAQSSATASATSETNAKASEENAKLSENNAKESELNSKTSETNAKDSETKAKASETASAISASNAKASETNSKQSETNAKISEENAKDSETASELSEQNAKTSETNAENSANKSESYAVGGTGTRTGEDTDNSKYYYQESKKIYEDFNSASDVKGVKGNKETTYRTGQVNLTPENIGAVSEEEGAELSEQIALNKQTLGYSKKNLVPYPYYETTHTENGITFTDNGDGTITVDGTATADAVFMLQNTNRIPMIEGEKYTFNGCPSGGGGNTYYLQMISIWEGNWSWGYSNEYGTGRTITAKNQAGFGLVAFFRIVVESGTTVNNVVFKPMFRHASISDNTYEPYVDDVDTRLNEIEGDYLAKTGDNSNTTTAFTQATTRANITTGEKLSAIMGKISKWFADLKTVAFTGSYNDLANKPSIPPAVAVKGNAETTYRTGNVNITAENVGAVALNGNYFVGENAGKQFSKADEYVAYLDEITDHGNRARGAYIRFKDTTGWLGTGTNDGWYWSLAFYQDSVNNGAYGSNITVILGNFGQRTWRGHIFLPPTGTTPTSVTFTPIPLQTALDAYLPLVGNKYMSGDIQFHDAGVYWREEGYGDKFKIVPTFSGFDDENKLLIQSAVGGVGTNPELTTKISIAGKSGDTEFVGNVNAKNIKLNTYTVLKQIGLTDGSETINDIANNLPDNSILFYDVGATHSTIYPVQYGTVTVEKKYKSRINFRFQAKGSHETWVGGWADNYWSGWQKLTTNSQILNTATAIEASTSNENIVGVQGLKKYVQSNGMKRLIKGEHSLGENTSFTIDISNDDNDDPDEIYNYLLCIAGFDYHATGNILIGNASYYISVSGDGALGLSTELGKSSTAIISSISATKSAIILNVKNIEGINCQLYKL